MQSKKSGVVFLAGLSALVMVAMAGVKAQPELIKKAPEKNAEKNPNPAMLPLKTANRGVQVIDVTPTNTVWPRTHVVYDFDRSTITYLTINPLDYGNGNAKSRIVVHEIISLTTVAQSKKE